MANEEHLKILRQGVEAWNNWRGENPDIEPDLSEANLSGVDLSRAILSEADLSEAILSEANLSGADLSGANLIEAILIEADLSKADLSEAILFDADLFKADFSKANLSEADFSGADLCEAIFFDANLSQAILVEANLSEADFSKANLSEANLIKTNLIQTNFSRAKLSGADLSWATLVETDLTDADLTGCAIYGVSAWELRLEGATQTDLIITRRGEPTITVDNLEVAQFIYLLLNNEKIRDVIETITSKVVLILGSFTPERKAVLDAIRDELRKRDYLPVLFDFDNPPSKNLTETVSTLAHLARFIIADITDARSIAQELERIVPPNPSVPVMPLILSSQSEYALFKSFLDYSWVLMPYRYDTLEELLNSLEEKVIAPATAKAQEIEERREAIEKEMAKDRVDRDS